MDHHLDPQPSEYLSITVCPTADGGIRVYLVGQLDLSVDQQVESALTEARRHGPILLDLSRLDFLDCTGLSLLLRAKRRDPLLSLVAPSAAVRRLATLARADLGLPEEPPRGVTST